MTTLNVVLQETYDKYKSDKEMQFRAMQDKIVTLEGFAI